MKTIALAHPITVNGKERSTIDLDFEALTVDAFTRADSRSHGGEGNVLTLMEANGTLHLNLAFEAAIAADQTLDITDLERLKGADIMKFAAAGRFFTLQSATDSQGGTSEAQSESTDESTTTPRAK
ncbi:phage tail assembly protein [Collinsella tanakaei]|uniref:phage tail assembly protein n=1 Tax=Collinsella tanakaei TaxID=626935 RepID=UPI0022DEB1B0|nr:phage tail assembly protein [Collinsella tanakaei]